MKNLNLEAGDILVVSYDGTFSQDYLNAMRRQIRESFEGKGIGVMFCPKGLEFSSIHIHKGNGPAPQIMVVTQKGQNCFEKVDETISKDKTSLRMIRADLGEVLDEG